MNMQKVKDFKFIAGASDEVNAPTEKNNPMGGTE
jgi:hypothetical protein